MTSVSVNDPRPGERPRARLRLRVVLPVAFALALGTLFTVPHWLAGRRAGAFFDGTAPERSALARTAMAWLQTPPEALRFGTGSPRFDGEWYLIIHMVAALGFQGMATSTPAEAPVYAASVDLARERMFLPRGREHDREAWNEDPLGSLAGDHGHLAFLAYANLGLSVGNSDRMAPAWRSQNQAITDALARRFAASPTGLVESYPGETYPADNAVALASILAFDRATGANHRPAITRSLEWLRTRYADGASGLLFQRVHSVDGRPEDAARASGTAMAAFALAQADQALARPFFAALAGQATSILGFGGILEYPPGSAGAGDVDSGPVILGMSVSATGFALGAARVLGERDLFQSLFASAWLFGLPLTDGETLRFVAGGPLGDALLFALLTSPGAP